MCFVFLHEPKNFLSRSKLKTIFMMKHEESPESYDRPKTPWRSLLYMEMYIYLVLEVFEAVEGVEVEEYRIWRGFPRNCYEIQRIQRAYVWWCWIQLILRKVILEITYYRDLSWFISLLHSVNYFKWDLSCKTSDNVMSP